MILFMNFDLYNFDWVAFSAIATLIMAIVTIVTLCNNKKQLNELKRQWDEEHRPNVEVYLTNEWGITQMRGIELINLGKYPAKNISFKVSENLINITESEDAQKALRSLGENKHILLLPNEAITLPLYEKNESRLYFDFEIAGAKVGQEEYENFVKALRNITISIDGSYNNKYQLKTTISLETARNRYHSISESIDNASTNIGSQIMNK